MLSDRSYMRDDYPREKTSVLIWLVCGIVAGFVLQIAFGSGLLGGSRPLINQLDLTIPGLQAGRIWTLITHAFLHDTKYLFHIFGNLLGLYFLGRELLPLMGAKRFLGLYFGAIVAGALIWTAFHWNSGVGSLFGATAAVNALLVVFACFYPNQRMDFLLFFVFPVSLRPKHVACALLAFDVVGLLAYELPGTALPFNFAIAHSAHLGGMMAGWIYFRYLHDVRWPLAEAPAEAESPAWVKRNAKAPAPTAFQVNMSSRADLRAEVDRILDKINSHGFSALTADEKRLLDEAKDLLSRR